MKTAKDAEHFRLCGVEHDGVSRQTQSYALFEHKSFILRRERHGSGLAVSPAEDSMSRGDWQALLFGLILLALCFVQ